MPHSQLKAMLAITKGSLRSIFRNPSAVVFNLLFPLIFIVVFGFIGGGSYGVDVAIDKSSDLNNPVYESMKKIPALRIDNNLKEKDVRSELSKGNLDGLINIQKAGDTYEVHVTTSSASVQRGEILKYIIKDIIENQNKLSNKIDTNSIRLKEELVEGRKYRTIDFILPGQLGFSLLSAGVFGTAFTFLSLRQTMVLKRFYATPIKRIYIVVGEGLSRLIFSLFSAVIIVLIGHYLFGFTLINGFLTFINILILSTLALFVFLGFGFVVSGIAKNENSVPAIANIITLPQFLLAGTFFPINNFPSWLQPVSKALPLTYLNEALRKVSFEGASLGDVYMDILILLGWGVINYAIASKVFKWE
ncbi:ABC transporter permease [soil metagenome]